MKFVQITTDARTAFGEIFRGEIRKVDADTAGNWIGKGWAENIEVDLPELEAGAKPDPVTLEVQNAKIGTNLETAG